jgi:lipopolysaccharide biosynthesis regulator YciM
LKEAFFGTGSVVAAAVPAFFGLGWLAAGGYAHRIETGKVGPTGFFRGLDALVDDKTDIAAQSLAEVSRQQGSAPELQLTLGKLYRKRGENDRAIRLHQRMLESSDLPAEQRDIVRNELAQDFRKAGLVDRAEEILLKLLNGNMTLAARRQLLDIYQQDRDWQRRLKLPGNCVAMPIPSSMKWRSSTVSWHRASCTARITRRPANWWPRPCRSIANVCAPA